MDDDLVEGNFDVVVVEENLDEAVHVALDLVDVIFFTTGGEEELHTTFAEG